MPHERHEWPSRVKAIEREYSTLRLAVGRLLDQARSDPNILMKDGVETRDVGNASRNLEGTYFIRLFAEFETGLRLYWGAIKRSHPRTTEDLVNGVASKCKISNDLIRAVHAMRDYRNSLVHEREDETTPVSLSSARRTICHFLSRLPESWG